MWFALLWLQRLKYTRIFSGWRSLVQKFLCPNHGKIEPVDDIFLVGFKLLCRTNKREAWLEHCSVRSGLGVFWCRRFQVMAATSCMILRCEWTENSVETGCNFIWDWEDIPHRGNKSWTFQDTFPERVAKGSCFLSWGFLGGLGVLDCSRERFRFAGL